MRVPYLFSVLALLLSLSTPALADDIVIGDTCSTVGTSVMTTDQKNIVVCLYDDSTPPKPIWKASTISAGSEGSWCGLAYADKTPTSTYQGGSSKADEGGYIITGWYYYTEPVKIRTCQSRPVITYISTGGYPYNISNNCPSGYSLVSFSASWKNPYIKGRDVYVTNANIWERVFFTCAKD